MALHVIRDKKGRMEKILDDKEYDRHQARKGCFQFLFFVAIVGLIIYGSAKQKSDGSSEAQTEVSAVEHEETISMNEDETASVEENFDEEENTESEDTSSVIDEDELVRRFLENQ